MANGSEFKTCFACTKPLFEGPLDGYGKVLDGVEVTTLLGLWPKSCCSSVSQSHLECFWKFFSGWKVIEFALRETHDALMSFGG